MYIYIYIYIYSVRKFASDMTHPLWPFGSNSALYSMSHIASEFAHAR